MEEKIKLLFMSLEVPYPGVKDAGAKSSTFYIKNLMENKNIDLKVISMGHLSEKKEAEEFLETIEHYVYYNPHTLFHKICKISNISKAINPFNRLGNLLGYYEERFILNSIKKLKNHGYFPDVIVLDWTQLVVLSKTLKRIYPNSKIIAIEEDVTFIGMQRKAEYFKGAKGLKAKTFYINEKKHEISALKYCDFIFVLNGDNKTALMNEGLDQKKIATLIPYFYNMSSCLRQPNKSDILFFGAMDRQENYLSCIWFIKNVMPLLNNIKVRFVVLGNNPVEELKQFENEQVHITGYVESIKPYFEHSACFVAPLLLGAGIKVKVIEALSSGIPVLTNSIGIEGIDCKNGTDYLHCETPEDYKKAITKIINDSNYSRNIGNNGKTFINEHFVLKDSLEFFIEKIQDLSAKH
jgi:glycosyltransferase involved in cell wall biosynthesis